MNYNKSEAKMILRNYSGDDGISRFEDIAMPLGLEGQAVKSISFRRQEPGTSMPLHTIRQRCYVITLSGEGELSNGHGEVRRGGPGHITLHEDLTGQGHSMKVISKDPRIFVIIALA